MNACKTVGHKSSVECHNILYGTPTIQKTAHHIIQGTQTDEGIVGLHLLRSGMAGIVANLLYRSHVLLKLPVFVDEGVYLRTLEHLIERLVLVERHVGHIQMVLYQPLQCLAGVAGTLLRESLLKDFRLIAVCV